ncbi:uncharacterized protein LOC131890050 [Tigriopus californicus]|uniref:uncharacterized protein LOC131890050 n=1 Tax=Tigriopus californicus TaxID=6832 RepID=UPI0027DA6F2E|nr:uncharacterized protein LOC131890050 [Tigriopus californicus]
MRVPIFLGAIAFINLLMYSESQELVPNRTDEIRLNSTIGFPNETKFAERSLGNATFASTNPCAHLNISDCFELITKAMDETEQMLDLANATLRGEATILHDQHTSEKDHEPVAKAGNGPQQQHLSDQKSREEDMFVENNLGSIFPFATNPMDAAKIIESQSVMMAAPAALSQKQPSDLFDEDQIESDTKRDRTQDEQEQQQRQLLQRLQQQQQLQRAISPPQMGKQNSKRRKRALPQKAHGGRREMEHPKWNFPLEVRQNQVAFQRARRNNHEEDQRQQRQLLQRLQQQQQLQRAISPPQMGKQNSKRRKRALPQKARGGRREMEHHKWNFPLEVRQNQVAFQRARRNNHEEDQKHQEKQVKDSKRLENDFNLVRILTNKEEQEPKSSETQQEFEITLHTEKFEDFLRHDPTLPQKWRRELNNTELRNEFVYPVLMADTLKDINSMHSSLRVLNKVRHEIEATLNPHKRFRRRSSLLDFLSNPWEGGGFQPTDSFLAQWASELNDLSKSNPGNGTRPKAGELKNNTTKKNDHPKEISLGPLKTSIKGLVLKVILAGDSNLTMGQLVDENLVPLRLATMERQAQENSTQVGDNQSVTEPSASSTTPGVSPPPLTANPTASGGMWQSELNNSLEASQSNAIENSEKLVANTSSNHVSTSANETVPFQDVSNLKHWEDDGLDLKHMPSLIMPEFTYQDDQDSQHMSPEPYFPMRMTWEEEEDAEEEGDNVLDGSFDSITKDLETRFQRENHFLPKTPQNNRRDPRHMHFHFNTN